LWVNMMIQKIRSARLNNRGMTLVEVMIALVIILVLMLGLIQAAILSIDGNLRNVFRDEATRIAEQTMGDLRNYPFDDAALAIGSNCPNNPLTVTRSFRDITSKNYIVCINVKCADNPLNCTAKSLQVVVGWNHKRENAPMAPTNTEFQQIANSIMRQ